VLAYARLPRPVIWKDNEDARYDRRFRMCTTVSIVKKLLQEICAKRVYNKENLFYLTIEHFTRRDEV
jgi:hypothetical protein